MDLTREQEELLKQVAAENERKAEQSKKKDRTRQMGDVVKAMSKRGFKQSGKVCWRLGLTVDGSIVNTLISDGVKWNHEDGLEAATVMLMRGLAYTIGRHAEWLPEYNKVAEWLADNQGKGLLCVGACGRGKTVITRDVLPLAFREVIRVRLNDGDLGHPVYNYFKATEIKSRWKEIEDCKIVCIDDIGTENQIEYGRKEDWFGKLVDLCNDRDKLLIGSTNLTMHQMFGGTDDEPDDPNDPDSPTHKVTYPQRYDERTYSRLFGNTVRVWFEGEDMRMKQ